MTRLFYLIKSVITIATIGNVGERTSQTNGCTYPSIGAYFDLSLKPRMTRTGLLVSADLCRSKDQVQCNNDKLFTYLQRIIEIVIESLVGALRCRAKLSNDHIRF